MHLQSKRHARKTRPRWPAPARANPRSARSHPSSERLQATHASAHDLQGTTQINGRAGAAFGDGLRCAGGTIGRRGTKANANGSSAYPVAGEPSVSVRGQVTTAGSVCMYQVGYRNAAAFCTVSTFNLSNGLSVTWGV
jgi:hypothetical protein